MELPQATEKLSTQSYWDEVLRSAQLPRVNTTKSYLYYITMKYVDRVLKGAGFRTFFEVGCGSSGWLPYFAVKYNFQVSGLDYSEIGCQLAKKNLEILNIDYVDIFCKDFFLPDPTEGKKYDVVFSYGVIEHFNEPIKVAGIFNSFLNEGGVMITLVPNFNGITARLTKYFIKDVYDIHNIISPKELASYHTNNGLTIIQNGYAGIFALQVIPWIKSRHWLFKEGTMRRRLLLFMIRGADRVMGAIFKALPFDLPSRIFSPYVICIAKKQNTNEG
jgi:2-polyprenyl-3-methyl-5-hydroxy-6-metoxy-1,4-benzoquinol methylase